MGSIGIMGCSLCHALVRSCATSPVLDGSNEGEPNSRYFLTLKAIKDGAMKICSVSSRCEDD